MNRSRWIWIGAGLLVAAIGIIAASLLFIPQETNPAYATALRFAENAAKGDEAVAFALLGKEAQDAVLANCPDGSLAACVDAYTPPDWGAMQSVVFRRAAPDPASADGAGAFRAYDIDLIATYAENLGFSGVCIYTRVEQNEAGEWRVQSYAGFISCGEPASRQMATNPDTPNRLP